MALRGEGSAEQAVEAEVRKRRVGSAGCGDHCSPPRQVGDYDVAVAPELALNCYHLGMLQQVDSLTLDDPRPGQHSSHAPQSIPSR